MSMTPTGGIVAGGTYTFTLHASKDGVTWDLTAATVTLILRKKGGSAALLAASLVSSGTGGVATYTTLTTDLASGGTWYCSWKVVQSSITVESAEESFPVQASLAAA